MLSMCIVLPSYNYFHNIRYTYTNAFPDDTFVYVPSSPSILWTRIEKTPAE